MIGSSAASIDCKQESVCALQSKPSRIGM